MPLPNIKDMYIEDKYPREPVDQLLKKFRTKNKGEIDLKMQIRKKGCHEGAFKSINETKIIQKRERSIEGSNF